VKSSLAAIAVLGVLAWGGTASAYCYTTTCRDLPVCDGPPVAVDGCIPLHWKTGCTGFTVYAGGSKKLGFSAETVSLIADLAFDTWEHVDCGDGAPPAVHVVDMGEAECEDLEYNKDAGNANVIIFRDDAWPNPDADNNIALTTTTFDPDTGELLDADMEINSATYDLTVSDEAVDYDLLSVITHESGHFLGLAHSGDPEATMFAMYPGGSTELRSPEVDDVAALCQLYPPTTTVSEDCNPLQRHGFSPYCRDDQPEGSCSVSDTRPQDASFVWLGGALVASIFATRRSLNRGRSGRQSP